MFIFRLSAHPGNNDEIKSNTEKIWTGKHSNSGYMLLKSSQNHYF